MYMSVRNRKTFLTSFIPFSSENSPLPARAHTPLGRIYSAPLKDDDDDEATTDTEEVIIDGDDKLSWSFGSFGK